MPNEIQSTRQDGDRKDFPIWYLPQDEQVAFLHMVMVLWIAIGILFSFIVRKCGARLTSRLQDSGMTILVAIRHQQSKRLGLSWLSKYCGLKSSIKVDISI